MKKAISFVLILAMAFSFSASVSAGRMVQTFSSEYYQMYIPGDWVIDVSDRRDYYGAMDLGYMYSSDKTMLIEAKMNFYSDWAQDALWLSSDGVWDEYVDFLLTDLKDESPEFITRFQAGSYPGALLKGTNSYGSYLYGEIMINAYAYGFYFYLLNEDDTVNSNLTQEHIDLFQSILETFTPVSQ